MSLNSQLGVKDESTYGTRVVVDRFFRMTKIGPIQPKQYRGVGKGLEATGYVERASLTRVFPQGASLPFEMEVETKGMGWWLKHLLGSTATTGPTDSAYTHTGTVGALYGDFFTAQANIPLTPAGTATPLTLGGCKIPTWELGCEVDGLVMLKGEIDSQNVVKATGSADATALQAASYASGVPYAWVDVALTIGGSSYPVESWSIKADSQQRTDKYKQNATGLKEQPTDRGRRRFAVDLSGDFSDLTTMWDRVRATVAASAMAQLVFTISCADTGTTIGASTQPSMTITIPKVSFDGLDGLGMEGEGGDTSSKLAGGVYWDASNSPVTIAYVSSDSTA